MKKYLIGIFVFVSATSFSQTYFFEDFNYDSFEEIDNLFQNKSNGAIWRTNHAIRDVDINENGKMDSVELYKSTKIVEDPFQKGNKILRFELNKISPKFYSKYACDDRRNNNVIEDAVLEAKFNPSKNLYCTDCSTDSPLKKYIYDWDVHMKRNEIAITGPSEQSLYKANRDHWFGFKMLLDKDYELETVNNGTIVSQFHLSGEGVVSPPIVLSILKDRFYFGITNINGGKPESYDLGPVEKNKWIDWKVHIKLSTKDRRGIVEVWRDGVKMHSIKGKNTYKNYRMYLKLGIYKYGWWNCNYQADETKRKVVSFDKVWANKKDRVPVN